MAGPSTETIYNIAEQSTLMSASAAEPFTARISCNERTTAFMSKNDRWNLRLSDASSPRHEISCSCLAMPIITLTTDFGTGSPYVAAMKGVILSINPAATIVDISHAVPAQDIARGALVLEDTTPWFPADTIHVAVVDPGVGTAAVDPLRPHRLAAIHRAGQRAVGPLDGPHAAVDGLAADRAGTLAGGGFAHVPRPRHHGPGRRPLEPGPRSPAARPGRGTARSARLAAARRWSTRRSAAR